MTGPMRHPAERAEPRTGHTRRRGGVVIRPLPPPPVGGRDALRVLGHGIGRRVVILLVLAGAAALLGLALPAATAWIFADIIPQSDRIGLALALAGIVLAAVGLAGLEFARATILLRCLIRVDRNLHDAVFDRLLRAAPRLFRRFAASDIGTRILDVDALQRVLGSIAMIIVVSTAFGIANLGFMLVLHPMLTLVGLGLVVLIAGLTRHFQLRQIRHEISAAEADAAIMEFTAEVVRRLEVLRVANAEGRARVYWRELHDRLQTSNRAAQRAADASHAANAAFAFLAPALLFAGVSVLPHAPSTASFLAFYAAFGQLLFAALALAGAATSAGRLVAPLRRIGPLINAPEEQIEGGIDPGPTFAGVAVDAVSFRYEGDAPLALDRVSLKVDPGEIVAVTGPSGSGKSTLLRLLLRLEDMEEGSIAIGGWPLRSLNVSAWRRLIGVVLQDSPLFDGTVASNIRGLSEASDEQVVAAAQFVGLDPGASDLPFGFDTPILRTDAVPGTLRQQLLLARAVVHRPQFLLLDEATSVMDSDIQAAVMTNIRAQGMACLTITHRLTGISMADRVYRLDRGRVAAAGGFAELTLQGERFDGVPFDQGPASR